MKSAPVLCADQHALKMSKWLSFNPFILVFKVNACLNITTRQLEFTRGKSLAFVTGFSAPGNFNRGITATVYFQYAMSVSEPQSAYFSGLYFIPVAKALAKEFKVGITSLVPFAKILNYQGSEIEAPGFHSCSVG